VTDGRCEVFERFTDGARQGVVLGLEEAYAEEADAAGTAHLLLGLLDQGDELVAEALRGAGFPEGAPRASPAYPPPVRTVHIPFTPEAARALRGSMDQAAALGEAQVSPGHLLLALLRSDDASSPRGGGATKLLQEQGIDVVRLQDRVIRLLSSVEGPGAPNPD
jgi:ATP-dependent Clp protease ATP-binding subunit ClpA